MSRVFFISDLHIGHKAVIRFSPERLGTAVSTIDEHDLLLVDRWNSVVSKRDVVWVLGDVVFNTAKLYLLPKLAGQKNLILGNHDQFGIHIYLKYFHKIHGFTKYKGLWLSHCPVHGDELRGLPNVHGHVHNPDNNPAVRDDRRYINVTVEALKGLPISIDEIKARL